MAQPFFNFVVMMWIARWMAFCEITVYYEMQQILQLSRLFVHF